MSPTGIDTKAKAGVMPLSEHEQRILADIEARLRQDDPQFARSVATRAPAVDGRRRTKWAVVAFIAGFVLLFVGLNVHLLWGVAGFVLMLGAAYQGLVLAKKAVATRPTPEAGTGGGPLQRYLDSARRRDDDET